MYKWLNCLVWGEVPTVQPNWNVVVVFMNVPVLNITDMEGPNWKSQRSKKSIND